jgi:hypothetical protein
VWCRVLPYLAFGSLFEPETGWDATGNVLGNGTWVNVGGNQAVTYCGASALTQNGLGDLPYNDPDRGQS